jgi:hypothetical protein
MDTTATPLAKRLDLSNMFTGKAPGRPRGKSYQVQTKGDAGFGRKMKAQAQSIVKIVTDDLDCEIGLYMGMTKDGFHKIVLCTDGQRQTWEYITVDPRRVKVFEKRSA